MSVSYECRADVDALFDLWVWMDPGGLRSSPMLGLGLIVAAGFAAGAIALRRCRDDS